MLLLFGLSLLYPPSMAERFARLREPDLPPAGVRYTRQLTQIWCVFFVANGAAAIVTAFYASREIWAWYNGFRRLPVDGRAVSRRMAVSPPPSCRQDRALSRARAAIYPLASPVRMRSTGRASGLPRRAAAPPVG